MGVFDRMVHSLRFWTAVIGIGTIVAVYLGMSEDVANDLSLRILALVALIIGGDTLRPTNNN